MLKRLIALLVAALVLGGAPEARAQAAKVKLGVLKLTSSAVLFVGAEKGYFKEFGVDPEFVFFDAAQQARARQGPDPGHGDRGRELSPRGPRGSAVTRP